MWGLYSEVTEILVLWVFIRDSRLSESSVGGVMVSIDAFQALDPGSIPGHRTLFFISSFSFF